MDRCFRVFAGLSLFAFVGFGCEPGGGQYKTAQQINTEKGRTGHEGHEHGAAGPHGGAIVELGDEEYHAEVVVDAKTHTLTVYLFGKDAKTPAAIAATEVTITDGEKLTLKAVDPKEGTASQFALADEAKVGPIVKDKFMHGALQVEIGGKPYRGEIDYHFDGSEHADEKHAEPEKKADAPKEEPAAKSDEPEPPAKPE